MIPFRWSGRPSRARRFVAARWGIDPRLRHTVSLAFRSCVLYAVFCWLSSIFLRFIRQLTTVLHRMAHGYSLFERTVKSGNWILPPSKIRHNWAWKNQWSSMLWLNCPRRMRNMHKKCFYRCRALMIESSLLAAETAPRFGMVYGVSWTEVFPNPRVRTRPKLGQIARQKSVREYSKVKYKKISKTTWFWRWLIV